MKKDYWSMPYDWARFWHIGDIDFGQPSSWLCVEEVSGRVFGIDVGDNNPVYLINASIESLATTMLHWIRWFSKTKGSVAAVDELYRVLANDATFTPNELDSFWKPFIDSQAESGVETMTVE